MPHEELEDTVRHLRALTESAGDLHFRQSIALTFDKVTAAIADLQDRLARQEERQVGRVEIAKIARDSQGDLRKEVALHSRILWAVVGAVLMALAGAGAKKLFG